jgi:uncharacterized protein (DUF2267 family)
MSATGLDVFDTTLQKTNSWLNELMRHLGWEDKHKAYQAMRVTLHTLRDRLTPPQVAQLGAQLPMLVRGFYYEGWRPEGAALAIRHKDEFLAPIATHFGSEAERVAHAVFSVLEARIAKGEIENIEHVLPKQLRALWPGKVKG